MIAADGEQGVAMAVVEQPDLVLDMSLPVLDGWEATRRLEAESDTRRIRIIGLTAHATTADRDTCLDAGCEEYDTSRSRSGGFWQRSSVCSTPARPRA
jgi:two-component system, cell cycle response regulator DivK